MTYKEKYEDLLAVMDDIRAVTDCPDDCDTYSHIVSMTEKDCDDGLDFIKFTIKTRDGVVHNFTVGKINQLGSDILVKSSSGSFKCITEDILWAKWE